MKKMNRPLTKNDIVELARKNGIKLHDDHPLPTTRREFLAQGLMGFAGYVMAPSLLTMVAKTSTAQTIEQCTDLLTPDPLKVMPGFLHLNLGGGAGLSGQWAVRKIISASRPLATVNNEDNLEYLSSYRNIGLGATQAAFNKITDQFANPFQVVANDADVGAQLFRFMREIAPEACKNTAATGVCVASQDDTGSNNRFGPQGLIHAVQKIKDIKFRIAMNLSNTSGTALTGVAQDAAGRKRPYAPIVVNRLQDIQRVIGESIGTETETGSHLVLPEDEKKKMLESISKLSGEQASMVASAGTGTRENFIKLYNEATGKSYCQLIVPQDSVNPFNGNATVEALWTTGITFAGNGLNGDNAERRQGIATLINSAIQGWSGTVGLNFGGYDYHGNARNVTDPRDADAGRILGAALKMAELANKKLFILVTSDGATGSQGSDNRFAQWQSDRGNGGCMLTFMYDPENPTKSNYLNSVDTQLGYYTDGQSAADNTVVGSPERATMAVVHRYLAFAGISDWKTILKLVDDRAEFTEAELQYIAKFAA
jgi:hypothetical protein